MHALNSSKVIVGKIRERRKLLERLCNFRQQKRTFFINQWRSFKRWQEVELHNKEYFEWKHRMRNFIKLDEKVCNRTAQFSLSHFLVRKVLNFIIF
jgi:hypothetical protein